MDLYNNLLITAENLKLNSELNLEIDDKIINNAIYINELKYIKPILTDNLFTALKKDIIDNGLSGITGNNLILLENYIQPCLSEFVKATLAKSLAYQFKNGTVMKKHDSTYGHFVTVELEELKYLITSFYQSAQILAGELTSYLDKNYQLYPAYYSNNNDYPKKSHSFKGTGIYFPPTSND